jgi:hypothetical protein
VPRPWGPDVIALVTGGQAIAVCLWGLAVLVAGLVLT